MAFKMKKGTRRIYHNYDEKTLKSMKGTKVIQDGKTFEYQGKEIEEIDYTESTAWQPFAKITLKNGEVGYVPNDKIEVKK